MELVAADHRSARGRLMAAVTHVCTLDYVAKMLGEDPELLEAIVYNDDNLTYGSIISVYTGPDDTITALTDDGIGELKDMLRDARITTETWHAFLDDFVNDAELVARIKAQSLR
jgi:hypothetical protein